MPESANKENGRQSETGQKMAVTIDIAVSAPARLGEGPVWDMEDARLWWVDIKSGLIHRFDPASGQNDAFDFGEPVGCIARRDKGGLIVAAASGFYLFDPDTGVRTALVDPESDLPGNRFNDGGCDPAGRFWAGTMHDDGTPRQQRGQFWRYNDDSTATGFLAPLYTSNGLAYSGDGTVMYMSDSNRSVQTIWAHDYDLASGTPSNQRVLFDCASIEGRPDGGTVDSDGCYWTALIGGWQVARITPEGKLDRTISVPVANPTKPMFGGDGLDVLYVTSANESLEDDPAQPHAGCLLAISGLGVTGLPQARFAG